MAHGKSNVDLVMKELGFGKKKSDLENTTLVMPHSPDEAHDRVAKLSFENRLNEILQPRTKRKDDRIYLLDFTPLRRKYGDNWNKQAKGIHAKIHEFLEKNLIPYDLYFQRDDVSYYLIISGIAEEMGHLKIRAIADDILGSVLKIKDANMVTINHVVVAWPKQVKFSDLPSRGEIIHTMLAAEDAHRNFVFSQESESSSEKVLSSTSIF